MTEQLETVNAKICYTQLGIEDHGILTFMIGLEWRGGGQGAGGYTLDQCSRRAPNTDEREGFGPGFIAIRKILETVGVSNWEDLKGKLVRAKIAGAGSSRCPIIGNILEDKWFDMKAFFEAQKSA